jgi:hypothetical protein
MAIVVATHATFFQFLRADWSTVAVREGNFEKNGGARHALCSYVLSYERFLSHRKVVFARGMRETQFYLARAYRSHPLQQWIPDRTP